jgi:hypothetical protein
MTIDETILLMAIGGHFIGAYWWLLMIINDYWWIFY